MTSSRTPAAAPITAAQHSIDSSGLDRLIRADVARRNADRQAIRDLLERHEVRRIARDSGIDLRKAEAAVATLDGKDLQDVAARARRIEEQLAGGSSITITTTTLIIILLVVILIIVAVK